MKDVETELHFLFDCTGYHEEPEKLYRKIPELPNIVTGVLKFRHLNSMPHTFSNYVAELWQKRQTLV